MDEHTFVPCL